MTTHQPPAQPVERTCFSCDRTLPADRFAGVHLGGKLVQQCDTCRAQQDYLAELDEIMNAMHGAHMRLTNLMKDFPVGPTGQRPDEWHDCYRASQAVHLANQLLGVARDNEQARRAPVPFLPVEPVEDPAPVPHDRAFYQAYARANLGRS